MPVQTNKSRYDPKKSAALPRIEDLIDAIQHKDTATVKGILSKEGEQPEKLVNQTYEPSEHGVYTPLMLAALTGTDEIVELLIQNGADATLPNEDGKDAIDYAIECKNTDIAILLLKNMPLAKLLEYTNSIPEYLGPEERMSKLHYSISAAITQHEIESENLTAEDKLLIAELKTKLPSNILVHTPITYFAEQGFPDDKKLQELKEKFGINAKNSEGETPLTIAVRDANSPMALALLSNGAYNDLPNSKEETPLAILEKTLGDHIDNEEYKKLVIELKNPSLNSPKQAKQKKPGITNFFRQQKSPKDAPISAQQRTTLETTPITEDDVADSLPDQQSTTITGALQGLMFRSAKVNMPTTSKRPIILTNGSDDQLSDDITGESSDKSLFELHHEATIPSTNTAAKNETEEPKQSENISKDISSSPPKLEVTAVMSNELDGNEEDHLGDKDRRGYALLQGGLTNYSELDDMEDNPRRSSNIWQDDSFESDGDDEIDGIEDNPTVLQKAIMAISFAMTKVTSLFSRQQERIDEDHHQNATADFSQANQMLNSRWHGRNNDEDDENNAQGSSLSQMDEIHTPEVIGPTSITRHDSLASEEASEDEGLFNTEELPENLMDQALWTGKQAQARQPSLPSNQEHSTFMRAANTDPNLNDAFTKLKDACKSHNYGEKYNNEYAFAHQESSYKLQGMNNNENDEERIDKMMVAAVDKFNLNPIHIAGGTVEQQIIAIESAMDRGFTNITVTKTDATADADTTQRYNELIAKASSLRDFKGHADILKAIQQNQNSDPMEIFKEHTEKNLDLYQSPQANI